MTDQPITKILSVEDDEFIRLFLKDVLWIHGTNDNIQFDMVSNIEEGKKKIEDPATRPQLVFLDLMLPQKEGEAPHLDNGLGLLEAIKTNPDLMGIKVMVFSSVKDPQIKEKVAHLGADRYMVKGEYLPAELIAAVREMIQSPTASASK